MDEELPRKKPSEFALGSELDRHSIDELEALETTLRAELERVGRAIAQRRNVREAAEAFFKRREPPASADG